MDEQLRLKEVWTSQGQTGMQHSQDLSEVCVALELA